MTEPLSQTKEPTESVLTLEVVDGGGFTARCSSCPEWHFESGDYEEVLKESLRHWVKTHVTATAFSVENGQVMARTVEDLPDECDHGVPLWETCWRCRRGEEP